MIERVRLGLRLLLALAFVLAGANHFIDPAFYLRIMPPFLPAHAALVGISGVAEILGGLGVILPRTRRFAGWGLIALLVAVFPANIYSAAAGINPVGPDQPTWVLWVRLPFQLLFLAWVYWTCLAPQDAKSSSRDARRE